MTPKQIKGFVREWEVGKQILNTCVHNQKTMYFIEKKIYLLLLKYLPNVLSPKESLLMELQNALDVECKIRDF